MDSEYVLRGPDHALKSMSTYRRREWAVSQWTDLRTNLEFGAAAERLQMLHETAPRWLQNAWQIFSRRHESALVEQMGVMIGDPVTRQPLSFVIDRSHVSFCRVSSNVNVTPIPRRPVMTPTLLWFGP